MQTIHIADFIQERALTAQGLKRNTAGLRTGLTDLDHQFCLHPGELTVVAARPSMGKTAFVLQVALHNALQENVPTLYFSLDSAKKLLVTRMAGYLAGVDANCIRRGNASADEEISINNALVELSKSKLYINAVNILSVSNMLDECEAVMQSYGLRLIVIDDFQLLKHNPNQKEIVKLIVDLKNFAGRLKVPIIITARVNRACEKRTDHRPLLQDAFGKYDVIVDMADNILFLYRPDYYSPDPSEQRNILEVIIPKQIDGFTGTTEVNYCWQTGRLSDL